MADLGKGIGSGRWGDLRIEGYIGGRKVITKTMSGTGADRMLHVEPDDKELIGDGIDATRVVLRVTDEYGSARPFATGAIALSIQGPGQIIGENPMSLTGGVGAVWIKTREAAGTIRLEAKHPALGTKTVEIRVQQQPAEEIVI
jgi:beta-galactosidase